MKQPDHWSARHVHGWVLHGRGRSLRPGAANRRTRPARWSPRPAVDV